MRDVALKLLARGGIQHLLVDLYADEGQRRPRHHPVRVVYQIQPSGMHGAHQASLIAG